jgi:hypothetical protein
MEMNVEETKVMRISRQPSPIQIMIGQRQLDIVEYFKYFGSMMTNYARRTCGIKFRIAMTKGESTRRLSSPAKWTLKSGRNF